MSHHLDVDLSISLVPCSSSLSPRLPVSSPPHVSVFMSLRHTANELTRSCILLLFKMAILRSTTMYFA